LTLETLASTNGHALVATRDIALLGYAEETRDLIHGLSPDVEIWGINAAHYFLKRKAHHWFQMHPRSWVSSDGVATGFFGRPKEHLEWMQKFEGNLWLLSPDADLPNGKPYPIEDVVRVTKREYFTSTFAYQMAYALYEHMTGTPIRRMYVYGINLTALEEYAHQRPCAEYWIGRLEQAGVEVLIPTGSALLKGALYPRRGPDLQEHAQERLQHWKAKYMAAAFNVNTMVSMQSDVKHWSKYLSGLAVKHPEIFNETLKQEVQEHFDKRWKNFDRLAERFTADLNGAIGMVKDNQHWLTMLGGVDFKAPGLPDLRLPDDKLMEDFDLPEEPRRI